MSKKQDKIRLIRHYKETTGKKEIEMHELAKWAIAQGWPLPKPVDPIDRLAKEFSQAAREEIRHDKETGDPYRANHAFSPNGQMTFWIDIDEAKRGPMLKSLVQRREQMIGDGLQLTFDQEHWNRVNPKDEPINLPMDFTEDIEWRRNSSDADEEAS